MASTGAPRTGHPAQGPGLVRAALVAAAVSLVLFVGGFAAFLFSLERIERDPVGPSDGIVALTGGAERVEDAIGLLARGYGTRLLITGVNERTNLAGIARLNQAQRAVLECCVDLDHGARNTVGNAAAVRDWAREKGFRSLVIVTSYYHLPRAMVELDAALPEVRKTPYAVVARGRGERGWSEAPARARLLLSEYAKLIAVWVRTRLSPAGSGPGRADTASLAKAAVAR